jgi:hypothetical protein
MNSAESTPENTLKAPIPSSPSFKQRVLKALVGLLMGTLLGGIVGAIGLGLVVALIGSESALFIGAAMAGAGLGAIYGALYGTLHGAFIRGIHGLDGGPKASRPKRAGRQIVIHLVCLSVITLVAYLWSFKGANLPFPSEVQSMTFSFYDSRRNQHVVFSVAPKDVPTMFTTLIPAIRDLTPKKWVVLGELEITCKDGRKIRVALYRTYDVIGAFSVNPEDPSGNSMYGRRYFRGGMDNATEMAIKTAYENSKQE